MPVSAQIRKQHQIQVARQRVAKESPKQDQESQPKNTGAAEEKTRPSDWFAAQANQATEQDLGTGHEWLSGIMAYHGFGPYDIYAKEQKEQQLKRPFLHKWLAPKNMLQCQELMSSIDNAHAADWEDAETCTDYTNQLKKYLDGTWCSQWAGNKYDIIFYGVSGYAGYLIMEYLKRVSLKRTCEKFSFAFAGRSVSKVQEMRDREFQGTQWEDTPILQASFDDLRSIVDLVKSAHIIVNVAGPYMLTEGEVLIDACIHFKCHYVDISGEIPWSKRVIELHDVARAAGVAIVPSAALAGGYPDLGVYLCAKRMRQEYGEELRSATCYVANGGHGASPSGGTLKTRATMSSAGDSVRKLMADPFSLGGYIPSIDRNGFKLIHIEPGTGHATPKVRAEDMDARMAHITMDKTLGIWRAPYMYAYFDTRVVRRANALHADLSNCPYGRSFNYMEFAMLPPDMESSMLPPEEVEAKSQGQRAAGPANVAAEEAELQAERKYYKEGEGPPLDEVADVWNGFFFHAVSPTGHTQRCCFIGADQYFETARIAVETALTLRFDRDKLPEEHHGGVLTTSVAGGMCLIKRLLSSGIDFRLGKWMQYSECKSPPL